MYLFSVCLIRLFYLNDLLNSNYLNTRIENLEFDWLTYIELGFKFALKLAVLSNQIDFKISSCIWKRSNRIKQINRDRFVASLKALRSRRAELNSKKTFKGT